MYKLLVLCCLLASALAGPFGLESRMRVMDSLRARYPRGCGDRFTGWLACAFSNSSDALAPHPRDCRLFFYCNGVPACRRCPAGLHFSPALHVCNWPQYAGCRASAHPSTTEAISTANTTDSLSTTVASSDPSDNPTENWNTTVASSDPSDNPTENWNTTVASNATGDWAPELAN